MRINLKQLDYIYAVLSMKSVSKAAEKCFISQPAMTQSIQDFEAEHQVSLFHRKGRTLEITKQGEEIRKEIAVLLLSVNEFENRLKEITTSHSGKVIVGIPPVILTVYFYEVISNFPMQNPNVEFEVVELGGDKLKNKFLEGGVDIAVLIEPFESSKIEKEILVESTISAVTSKKHPLSQKKPLLLEDLVNENLILLNEDFQLYHVIMESFQKHGINPKIVFKSKQWDLLINMIIHNPELISILPTPIVDIYGKEELTSIPVELTFDWKIIMTHKKNMEMTPARLAFMTFVRDWFKKM